MCPSGFSKLLGVRVVVAHENLDFDALGSMVLAGKLFPGSLLAVVGGLEGPLK